MTRLDSRNFAPPLLTYGGLVPFFAASSALWLSPNARPHALMVLLGYSAVILSFLGGTRWGIEAGRADAPDPRALAASVIPALAAWGMVALDSSVNPIWPISGFMMAFGLQFVWDARSDALPGWYRRVRFGATGGALLALFVALMWAFYRV